MFALKHIALLFSYFILHGYLPRDFMKTAIVPIIKNKSGISIEKANYKPIALDTACSKIFESCLLILLENLCILMIMTIIYYDIIILVSSCI